MGAAAPTGSYSGHMTVVAVLCLALAALVGGSGLRTLLRPGRSDLTGRVLRSVAPTQVAGAVMLAAAGATALAAPPQIGLIGLVVGVTGAVATIAAGSWRGARYAERAQPAAGCESDSGCGGCATPCGDS